MKKLFLLSLITICIPLTQAQLLWKVTGKGLNHPSYIFGTHHLIPISFLDSVPGLYKAFNSSKVVIGEIVTSNVDAASKIQQAAIMPKHINIKDLLSSEEYDAVDKEIKLELKMGLNEIGIMHPALILTLYEIEVYKRITGYKEDVQSDSYFQLVATEDGKQVIGLETVEQQIDLLFGNKNLERSADLLVEAIQNKNHMIVEIVELNNTYKLGKIDDLVQKAKQTSGYSVMTNEEYNNLVDKRNSEWINKLPDLFKQNSCFIAVGALHLGGENGLVKKLQQLGYKVKPM